MSRLSYESRLTIPKGTTISAPASDTLEVTPGILKLVRLIIPPGPRGEIELWLSHQTHQFLPVPPGTYNNIDDDVILEPVEVEIPVGETDFVLYGIAPNANFDHTVSWALLVEATEIVVSPATTQSLLDRISSFFS